MAKLINGLPVLGVVCAAALILLTFQVAAAPADKNGASEASEPKDAGMDDACRPDENAKEGDANTSKDEGKPDEAPSGEKAEGAPPAAVAG